MPPKKASASAPATGRRAVAPATSPAPESNDEDQDEDEDDDDQGETVSRNPVHKTGYSLRSTIKLTFKKLEALRDEKKAKKEAKKAKKGKAKVARGSAGSDSGSNATPPVAGPSTQQHAVSDGDDDLVMLDYNPFAPVDNGNAAEDGPAGFEAPAPPAELEAAVPATAVEAAVPAAAVEAAAPPAAFEAAAADPPHANNAPNFSEAGPSNGGVPTAEEAAYAARHVVLHDFLAHRYNNIPEGPPQGFGPNETPLHADFLEQLTAEELARLNLGE
jgi:hypothetical protein